MRTMIIDGNPTLDLAFLAVKFNGAIKRHKKTVAAIRFDELRMNKTEKTGRRRAVVERRIVQELDFDIRHWSGVMLFEEDQKVLEAEHAGAFEEHQQGGWHEERCFWCGDYGCDSTCQDDAGVSFSDYYCDSRMDDGCPDCGYTRCQCGADYFEDDYGICDHDFSFSRHVPTPAPDPMTEEEKMKLSDELWLEHESHYGRNDLRTMTRSFSGDYYNFADDDYYGFGGDYYGFDEFDAYENEPVDEFGGFPNHFETDYHFNRHRLWECKWFNMCFPDFPDESDYILRLDPMMARRASRFSEIPGTVTYIDQTGFEVTDGKVKRVGRHGRTFSYHHLIYRLEDKDRVRMMDKTAAKRAHRRLLDELFDVEPKKGQKLRFKSMDEKEQYEKRFRAATKGDASKRANVDYSLPARRTKRRMVLVEVQVTRISTDVNGRRRILSDGVEKMLCRR
jgi:hypothetical protein